jgi:hypothetical protein
VCVGVSLWVRFVWSVGRKVVSRVVFVGFLRCGRADLVFTNAMLAAGYMLHTVQHGFSLLYLK